MSATVVDINYLVNKRKIAVQARIDTLRARSRLQALTQAEQHELAALLNKAL